VQVVQLLLQVLGSAAGINAQDGYDRTALQSASEKGHSEVVQMLLQVPGISI
jgi:ankyrin repeat protein